MGLLSSGAVMAAIGGLGEGGMVAARDFGQYVARSSLQEELAQMMKLRDERLAELSEQAAVRAEDRKRAPYKRASAAADAAVANAATLSEDASGNVTRTEPSAVERARLRAGAYEAEGLPEAASHLRTEGLAAEKLDLERSSLARREASDERRHTERTQILQKTLNVQERMAERAEGDGDTSLIKNIKFLMANQERPEVAQALGTIFGRRQYSEEAATERAFQTLLKNYPSQYRGEAGRAAALTEARKLVRSIRSGDDAFGDERSFEPKSAPKQRRPLDAFLSTDEED